MPFKSEKQRRFLWAEHPDIAKRWAKKYPESNKDLPMYAHDKADSKEKEAALAALNAAFAKTAVMLTTTRQVCNSVINDDGTIKKSNDGLVRVELPKTEGPTYAGQEREEGEKSDVKKPVAPCSEKALDMSNPVVAKLATVLSKGLRKQLEELRAQEEGREPMHVPENMGIKRYAISPQLHQLPMGMQPQAPAAQPQQQANNGPVGGGSNPQFNPIQAFGPLSASGQLNGNAAFGQKNSPDSSKTAGVPLGAMFSKLFGGAGKGMAQSNVAKTLATSAPKLNISSVHPSLIGPLASARNIPVPGDLMAKRFAYANTRPTVAPHLRMRIGGNGFNRFGDTMTEPAQQQALAAAKARWQAALASRTKAGAAEDKSNTPCSCGCGDTVSTCKCSASCKCRQPGGSCYKAEKKAETKEAARGDMLKLLMRKMQVASDIKPFITSWDNNALLKNTKLLDLHSPRATPMQALRGVQIWAGQHGQKVPARGTIGAKHVADVLRTTKNLPVVGIKPPSLAEYTAQGPQVFDNYTQLFDKLRRVPVSDVKTAASSPAWQRSAGKNPEGGLNEKGRKSYERETGGNLKAPVTESNPSGERAKRQNSFCSRMCGMKRVNTGASTAKDPDSRINKSLRKWNCKCSAYEFGEKMAAQLNLSELVPSLIKHVKNKFSGGEAVPRMQLGITRFAFGQLKPKKKSAPEPKTDAQASDKAE